VAKFLADGRIVTCSVGGHGEVPLPPPPLSCILGLWFDEVNEQRRHEQRHTEVARPHLRKRRPFVAERCVSARVRRTGHAPYAGVSVV
jgi:hypothetical protein